MSRSPRNRSHSYSRSRSRSPAGYRDGYEENNSTIFAGNLNHDTTADVLRSFFAANTRGNIIDVKIIYDQETGRSRGFGFVKFDDQRDADDAIATADGKILEGRPLKCNMARGSGGRGGFRGGFRGGYRGGPPMRGRGGGRFGDRADYNYGGRGGYNNSYYPPRSRRRSRSASPGRYSPGRYSPGRSESPPPKRTRHRSREAAPVAHQPPAGNPAPDQGAPRADAVQLVAAPNGNPVAPPRRPLQPGRRPGSPSGSSSYTSGSSYSTTDSEVSPRRERAAPPPSVPKAQAPAIPAPGSFRKELQEAKQRESEQSMRAAALEAEIEQSRAAKQELTTKLDETAQKLQRSEESCKQYRKWLAALADYARAVITGRETVRAAEAEFVQREEELGLFLQEADSFLASQKHRSGRRKRSRQTADAEGIIKPEADGQGTEAGAQTLPAEHGSEGMQLDDPTHADAEANSSAAAKFKPGIKFKLVT